MIYVTGDTHGEQARLEFIFSDCGISWTIGDYLIVCGDFGFTFSGREYERVFLDKFENQIATILFIDGNHENFDLLYQCPVEMWGGGKIHRIRRNIVHLMRGQVFEIEKKRFFTMGGGNSVDKHLRKENEWWAHEMPSPEEYSEALKNLGEHVNKIDVILTHTAPSETLARLGFAQTKKELPLNNFLEYIRETVQYKHWYFAHVHRDCYVWRNQTSVYYDIINIRDSLDAKQQGGL